MPHQDPKSLLSTQDIETGLKNLDGWQINATGALFRQFAFKTFSQAFGFMTRVALLAEKADHHPDWSNSYNTVDIALINHAAGGITQKDLDLAKAIDAL